MKYAAILAILAVLLVACGGDKKEGAAATDATSCRSAVAAPNDWKKFAADGVEVSLPSTYFGGPVNRDQVTAIASQLKALGRQDLESLMAQAPDLFKMLMVDAGAAGNGPSSLNVVQIDIGYPATAQELVDTYKRDLLEGVELKEERIVRINCQDSAKLVQVGAAGGAEAYAAQYILTEGNRGWVFTYGAYRKQDFDALLPTFERSAQTIKVGLPVDR